MNCQIEINMDNAAFADGFNGRAELSRILSVLSYKLETGDDPPDIFDANGNNVGSLKITV